MWISFVERIELFKKKATFYYKKTLAQLQICDIFVRLKLTKASGEKAFLYACGKKITKAYFYLPQQINFHMR